MQNFSQRFESIYKIYCEIALQTGMKSSKLGLAKFLGISQGRLQSWEGGQVPRPSDLILLHDKIGLAYKWLITGEGEVLDTGLTETLLKEKLKRLEAENERLRLELADADRINRQLTTRLLVDGVGDKNTSSDTAKAAQGG